MSRPRLGISRCLLGDRVRHDGGHKYEPSLAEVLAAAVEWVPVCPELEVGMGVPREPIHLVSDRPGGLVRLVGVTSGADWTDGMHAWARTRVRELRALGLSGFVLKSRSPSCGLRRIPVQGAGEGAGMFTTLLLQELPGLPVEEEDRLREPAAREEFLTRVRAYDAERVMPEGGER